MVFGVNGSISMTLALLKLLTWPYLRRHWLRYLLAASGIALAVAVYTSMQLANNSLKASFLKTAGSLAGSSQLEISASGAGVPEDTLDRARAAPCVDTAVALIVRSVSAGFRNEGGLALLGVDLLDDAKLRDYRLEGEASAAIEDALVFLAQPDSVLLTRGFAQRHGLRMGSALPIWTGREQKVLRVRGLLADTGVAQAYGGNVAVMDLYAAQHTLGQRRLFDRVDLTVRAGQDIDRCSAEVSQAVGRHLRVERPASRTRRVEDFSRTYLLVVESSIVLGMLVAMFLVHHASATAVAQREREIGIVLGLGASDRAVSGMVLVESAVLGALGSAAGILIGWTAARYLRPALEKLLAAAFGVHVIAEPVALDPLWTALVLPASTLLCVLSSAAPARSAAAVAPIQLMQARSYSNLTEPPARRTALLAALCGVAAVAIQMVIRRPQALYVTLPLAVVVLWLAGRTLTAVTLRALRPLFTAVWPVEGPLAIDGLLATNRRTRGTLLGLALTIAAVLAISGVTAAYGASLRAWMRQVMNADFMIHSSGSFAQDGELFPAATLHRLRSVAGAAAVIPARRVYVDVDGRRARLVAGDLALWGRYNQLGADAAGHGAVVSRNFANLAGRRAGDRLRIQTPSGLLELPVQAVVDDLMSEAGVVYIDLETYRRHFLDDSIEMFLVYAAPTASKPELRRALLAQFDPRAPVVVVDGAEFRAYLNGMVDQWRAASYIQVLAALLIALVGVGNFLVVSIHERKREFGLLTLLGATPGQTVRCVLVEALAVAAAAVALGILLGLALESYLLFTLRESVNGYALPWLVDYRMALLLALIAPLGALAAAALPIRSLLRMPLAREVEADA